MNKARRALSVVPWPRSVKILGGEYAIPSESVITYSPGRRDVRFSAMLLAKALRSVGKPPQVVKSANPGDFWLQVSTASAQALARPLQLVGQEGYALEISDHITLHAESPAGLFYGVQTLIQAIEAGQGTLPKCEISDSPAIPFRAVMIDMARLKERDDYYFKLVDFMSHYKFNAIFLHLVDDQGSPIELKQHHELASNYAMTQDTIKRLIEYAAQRHIDVIPEIEGWGHANWITRHDRYSDIAEEGADLCTMNPKTWELLGEIYDEICGLFPSKYVHGGCDEAKFGKCPKCKAEIEKNGEHHVVGLHLKRTAELIHKRGKTPILWGDVLLNYPDACEMIPKYAVINHWDYAAEFSDEPVKLLKSKGFTVMGGSGLVFGSRAVLPKGDALRNVERFGEITRQYDLAGINNTIWVPQRYVSDTLWYGIALAGEASWSNIKPDRAGMTTSFFKSYFGIDAGVDLVDAITILHDLPAYVGDTVIGLWVGREEFDELAAPEVHVDKEACIRYITAALKTIRDYKPMAVRHKWDYSALIYSAQMKRHIGERSATPGRLVKALERAKKSVSEGRSSSASKLLAAQSGKMVALADREMRLANATEKYWDRWRHTDDPVKSNPFQNTLNAFKTSDGYLRRIAAGLKKAAEEVEQGREPYWEGLLAES